MDLGYGEQAYEFRTEVRAFLERSWGRNNGIAPDGEAVRRFRELATECGYLYRSIPRCYGGSEQAVDVIKAQIIREEFRRVRAPTEVGGNGLSMLVPTLLDAGTEEQRATFIPPTLSGEFVWGQGFSEPGAGSDLAAIATKGTLSSDGERWIINGQKIWTSMGGRATHMFMLVKTEADKPKHESLTYLLVDLAQPGVTRKPIKRIIGAEGADTFHEFFFDEVETPASWQVGERGDGWRISRTTLKHERASIGGAETLGRQFAKLIGLAEETDAISDPRVQEELVRIEGFVLAHRASSYRLFSLQAANESDGSPLALMMKVLLTDIGDQIAILAQEILGEAGWEEPNQPGNGRRGPNKWLEQIFGSLGNGIAGGTSNIQRNIIAERGLGLPRDATMGGGA